MSERYTISLRIWHPTKSSQLVVEQIGLDANFLQSINAPRTNPIGQALTGFNKETYCSFCLIKNRLGYFIDGLRDQLSFLKTKSTFFKQITNENGRSELFVGVFVEKSSGFVLNHLDMNTYSKLGIDLAVEYYI